MRMRCAGVLRGAHMDERRQQADEQVGIRRIADDQAAEDARQGPGQWIADPDLAVDGMAGLEGVVREHGFCAGLAEEGVGLRSRRQHVVALFELGRGRRLLPGTSSGLR